MTMVKQITEATSVTKAGSTGLCTGTTLRTPCGGRRVEFLRVGDLIVTRDNGLQPVRLIWTRTVSAAEIAADPSLAPVVFLPRAIGPLMPQRSVSIGAAHRVLVPGWRLLDVDDSENSLVPARDMAGQNDSSYIDRSPEEVTYYNIVFDEPQVFCVNGLPVESFTPTEEALRSTPLEARAELKKVFSNLLPHFDAYPAPKYKVRERVSYSPV